MGKKNKVQVTNTARKVIITEKLKKVIKLDEEDEYKFKENIEKLTEEDKKNLTDILNKMAKPLDNSVPLEEEEEETFDPLVQLHLLQKDYDLDKLTYEEYITNPEIEWRDAEDFKDTDSNSFKNDIKNYKSMKKKMRYFEFVFSSRVVAILEEYRKDPEAKKQGSDEVEYLKNKYDLIFSKKYLAKLKFVYSRFYKYKKLASVLNFDKYDLEELNQIHKCLATSVSLQRFWTGSDLVEEGFKNASDESLVDQLQKTNMGEEDEEKTVEDQAKKAKGKAKKNK